MLRAARSAAEIEWRYWTLLFGVRWPILPRMCLHSTGYLNLVCWSKTPSMAWSGVEFVRV
jgi:hypothetical protein